MCCQRYRTLPVARNNLIRQGHPVKPGPGPDNAAKRIAYSEWTPQTQRKCLMRGRAGEASNASMPRRHPGPESGFCGCGDNLIVLWPLGLQKAATCKCAQDRKSVFGWLKAKAAVAWSFEAVIHVRFGQLAAHPLGFLLDGVAHLPGLAIVGCRVMHLGPGKTGKPPRTASIVAWNLNRCADSSALDYARCGPWANQSEL
ncbi:uncharacterized protein BDZ99DRAFT_473176 [Mytilinidion resinicola]|uniref:Uncharacterized protein n=1 Tax=Mytilinidion resinicola TaxID=574789 RepID=A0A6A6YYQ4_9PEZI|nr:uncharacterized protein BDZ99DRAFT_473176 [Mytilinidion resinicola]KAF2814052.1 hypothetical protein BDZ99DRAFT_473176 [Mytilinidion resinicola]